MPLLLPYPRSNFSALCWNAEHVLRRLPLSALPLDTPDTSVHVRCDRPDRRRINQIQTQHCLGCHLLHFTHNIERAAWNQRRKCAWGKVIKQGCYLAEESYIHIDAVMDESFF